MVENVNYVHSERLNSNFCEEQFEQKVANLPRLKGKHERFITENFDLEAKKLTAVCLVGLKECRYELLLAENPRSGYAQMDHETIFDDNQIKDDLRNVLNGIYFETGDRKRYLIINNIEYILDNAVISSFIKRSEGMLNALQRYKINTVFSSGGRFNFPPGWEIFAVDEINKSFCDFIFGDWTKNMAAELGWTWNDLIRFRNTGELPTKKN